jgi:hypothetical protein
MAIQKLNITIMKNLLLWLLLLALHIQDNPHLNRVVR